VPNRLFFSQAKDEQQILGVPRMGQDAPHPLDGRGTQHGDPGLTTQRETHFQKKSCRKSSLSRRTELKPTSYYHLVPPQDRYTILVLGQEQQGLTVTGSCCANHRQKVSGTLLPL